MKNKPHKYRRLPFLDDRPVADLETQSQLSHWRGGIRLAVQAHISSYIRRNAAMAAVSTTNIDASTKPQPDEAKIGNKMRGDLISCLFHKLHQINGP